MNWVPYNPNSLQISGLENSGSCVLADIQRPGKRQLNSSATELEPAIKQERVDTGYDQAMLNQTGTVLGSVLPATSAPIPYPVTVLSNAEASGLRNNQPVSRRGRPRKSTDARPNRTASVGRVNGHGSNSNLPNRPVVLLPHGGVTAPRRGPLPIILPRHPVPVPRFSTPRFSATRGLTTIPTSVASGAPPVVVRVNTSGPRIVRTASLLSATTTSSASTCRPIVVRRSNGMRVGPKPLDKLKAIIGTSVLEKYVGPHEPPAELRMPARSKRICQGCGDEFVTNVGLVDHVSRRSMLLSFHCTCNLARWPRLFYNPCIFESFYRSHCSRPGKHVARNSVVISALELDTPEYRSRLEAQNREKDSRTAGEKEVGESLANTNTVTVTADSDSDSHPMPAVGTVKEIYVNVEVVPDKQRNEQVARSGEVAKDTTAVAKEVNKNCVVRPSSAAKSGLLVKKGRPQVDHSLLAKVVEFFNALSHNRTRCQECTVEYRTRRWLAAHFSRSRTKHSLQCAECALAVPTPCSLSAHRRLHDSRPPFVCPQCGIVFDAAESAEVFRAHVERHCFHLVQTPAAVPASNCPRCSFNVPDDADGTEMARHFVDAHASVYYKCRACPKAFGNVAVAEKHSENTGHDAAKDIVRKCPSCDAVFREGSETEMHSHVVEHLTSLGTPQLRCPICTVHGSRRSVIVEHMRSCHPDKILPATTCEVCGQPHGSREELFAHVSSKHVEYYESVMKCIPATIGRKSTSHKEGESQSESGSATAAVSIAESVSVSESDVRSNPSSTEALNTPSTGAAEPGASISEVSTSSTEAFECLRCLMKFSSEDVYERHQAKHRFLESKKAVKKRASASKSSGDPSQQVPVPKERRCTRCCQTFGDAPSLNRHISTVHGSPGWHLCHLCADGFSTGQQLQRHVEIRHCGKTESAHAYVCALCAESPGNGAAVGYPVQGLLTKHLQSAHGVPRISAASMARAAAPNTQTSDNAEQVPENPGCSSSEADPVRRLFVSGETTGYQCSRCDFSTEDRADFATHASEHSPAVAGAVQCKECAASFTVASGLHRHLRVVHRMNCDVDTYLVENGGAARSPTPDTSTEDVEPSSPDRPGFSAQTSGGGRGRDSRADVGKVAAASAKGGDGDDDAPVECTVCYRVFFSKQLLRTHMRVHGMAFIQRTRRGLSSPSV